MFTKTCENHKKRGPWPGFFFDPAIPGCKSTYIISGWCFGTCFQFFPSIGNVIIPTDFHIFPRGGSKPPTSRSFSTGASLSSLFLYVKPRATFPPNQLASHGIQDVPLPCHVLPKMFYLFELGGAPVRNRVLCWCVYKSNVTMVYG